MLPAKIQKAAVVALLLSAMLAGIDALMGDCPPCVRRMELEPGARHGSTADGRRIVKVCITNTWDVSPGQTDPRVWNAVVGAINDWNNATDNAGNRIPYFLDLDQGSLNDDCTLPIYNQASAHCAHIVRSLSIGWPPPSQPSRIVMPASTVVAAGAAGTQAGFSHEFGHAMGLSGSVGGCCPAGAGTRINYSIMGGARADPCA